MDSRMVAGAIDYLIKTKRLQDVKVTGLTWGNEGSRDVVYAKECKDVLVGNGNIMWLGWNNSKIT